jgi:leucine dehydrogenase
MSKTENIYNTTLEIIDYAANGITTHHMALTIAQTASNREQQSNLFFNC